MRKIKRLFIFIIVLGILLLISNPSSEKHKKKIVEKFKKENPLTGQLGAGDLLTKAISYDDYYLFSISRISINNEAISFGVGSYVLVYKSLDIYKLEDLLK